MTIRLGQIAYARSGDKGSSANIGVIAHNSAGYEFLLTHLTAAVVENFFKPMGARSVVRFELPNLLALNFIVHDILDRGGSLSLRIDAQGKALGQGILELPLEIPPEILDKCVESP
jgi:hypothetical protein